MSYNYNMKKEESPEIRFTVRRTTQVIPDEYGIRHLVQVLVCDAANPGNGRWMASSIKINEEMSEEEIQAFIKSAKKALMRRVK